MSNSLIKMSEYITSLELAEMTGKQHRHVMRDIREMEDALQLTINFVG